MTKAADRFICLTFIMVIISVSFALQSNADMNTLARINAGYIRENAIAFSVLDTTAISQQLLCEELAPGNLLYAPIVNTRELELIALGDQTDYSLKEGRQLSIADLHNHGATYCYVGVHSNVAAQEAISLGTLGIDTKGLLDYMSITAAAAENITLTPGVYTIDGASGTLESRNRIVEILGAYAQPTEHIVSGNYRLPVVSPLMRFVPISLMGCSLLALLALTAYWLDSRGQLMGILMLAGIQRKKICAHLFQQYLWPAIVGILIGCATVSLVIRFTVHSFFIVLLSSVAVAFFLAVGMTIGAMHNNKYFSVYEVR